MTVESLQAELAALPNDEESLQRQLDDLSQKRETLSSRILAARTATDALANMVPEMAAEIEWRDHLIDWRQTLCDELLALPPRIRTDRELGAKQNLTLSILTIDRGRPGDDAGWALENLRLGQLMREAGYREGPKIENQVIGRLPWYGSMPDVEHRIKELTNRRNDAQARLTEALLDDAEREQLAAERNARNAAPTRKTRGDGSQYDRHADGRVVEIST